MATSTKAGFWNEEQLPAVLKHELLDQYLPRFAGKLGLTFGKVVLLDGYAGEGMYETGAPGSALQMVEVASNLVNQHHFSVDVFLTERSRKAMRSLEDGLKNIKPTKGLEIFTIEGDIAEHLEKVVDAAEGSPLFMFLDPCGLGLPFSILAGVLSSARSTKTSPAPTEILLNFSAEAVRRIGGHLVSKTPDLKALSRMDENVGGDWWRACYNGSIPKDQALEEVVRGYMQRLGHQADMSMLHVPVKRKPNHQPLYYLVFGTRHPQGAWHFADSAARANERWWDTHESRESEGMLAFEGLGLTADERRQRLEEESIPKIADNLARILAERGNFTVGDHPKEVFGEYLGIVRDTVVRKAVKLLHEQGRTTSDSRGKIDRLQVIRPV